MGGGLLEASSPKPFSDEQTEYVITAARLNARANGNEPKCFSALAENLIRQRLDTITHRQCLANWNDAQEKARQLLKDLRQLPYYGELNKRLEEFCEEAKRVVQFLDEQLKNLGDAHRRERPDVWVTMYFALSLTGMFRDLFEQEPTASPEGPFQNFADAYLEVLSENIPAGVSVKLPTGATLCKYFQRIRKITSK
jgi:hypothetical protein